MAAFTDSVQSLTKRVKFFSTSQGTRPTTCRRKIPPNRVGGNWEISAHFFNIATTFHFFFPESRFFGNNQSFLVYFNSGKLAVWQRRMDQQSQNERRLIESAIEAYADSMFRVAFRLLGSREQAEEVVQETWIGAWKNTSQLRDPSQIKSWLFGILRNQCYTSVKRTRRIPQRFECLNEPIDHHDNANELQQQVQQAIQNLDEDQRLPILLVSMEGWTTQEAADFLQIPLGTVLSRLHRGRQRLKDILSRELELDQQPE